MCRTIAQERESLGRVALSLLLVVVPGVGVGVGGCRLESRGDFELRFAWISFLTVFYFFVLKIPCLPFSLSCHTFSGFVIRVPILLTGQSFKI